MPSPLQEITRELKRLRDSERNAAKYRERTTGLTGWTLRTAMCIGALCGWDFTLAAEWVASKRRRGAQPSDMDEEFDMQSALEDVFLTLDLQELSL